MGPPPVSLVLVIVLSLTASLTGPTMVQGSSVPHAETTTTTSNMTREGEDNQCFPLQKRQDLLDNRMNERDTRLTERDTDLNTRLNGLNSQLNGLNTQLNGLNTRQNEVDARLNRMDSRFDDLETVMSDFKEYLRQRMDAIEVKAEWALTGTKQKGENREAGSRENRPTRTSQIPKDCQEGYTMGWTTSGVYRITPEPRTHIDVYCEQELDGGGWTVFQLRKDGSVNFFQDWNSYKLGFGELTSEFWLGNNKIHLLTKDHDQQLKIELMSPEGEVKYADYSQFWIADEAHKYKLNITGYSGGSPPGDSMHYHNGQAFSTRDRDNDKSSKSCAEEGRGGWWYNSCNASNLNGLYGSKEHNRGLNWEKWTGEGVSMNATRMMVRKKH